MAIWTAVWGQVSTDKQHTSCHCCSPLTIQTVEGSVAAGPDEWSSSLWQAGLVQILQGSAKYTQVSLPWNTENGDLHSFPLLALYSCNFLSWSWFTPLSWSLCSHPSPLSSLPQAPSTLLTGQEPLLATSAWLSSDTAGLGSSYSRPSPAWPQVLEPGPPTSPCPCLSPALDRGVQCPGAGQGRGWNTMKHILLGAMSRHGRHKKATNSQHKFTNPAWPV